MLRSKNPRKASLTQRWETTGAVLFFLVPSMVCLAIWFAWPMLQSFLISFQDYNYIHRDRAQFVGLQNYITLFQDPDFFIALKHSIFFVLLAVPAQTFLSMLLAVLVNSKIKGRGFFRTAYYTPYVLSAVAVATVFMYFFVKGGAMSVFFSWFGIEDVTWYANVKLAMPFIGILYIWQTVGFYMIYYLSGLQTIPSTIYEAAKIDGANDFQVLVRIMLPVSKPFMATFTLFYAVERWNEWWNAYLYIIDKDLKPLQIYLRDLLAAYNTELAPQLQAMMENQHSSFPMAVHMSAILLTMLPIICVYPFVQKYFVKGVMLGSIKQ